MKQGVGVNISNLDTKEKENFNNLYFTLPKTTRKGTTMVKKDKNRNNKYAQYK